MDGAPAGVESFWLSVIRWKPVFSSNWKNIKNRRGKGAVCQLFLGMACSATYEKKVHSHRTQ
jgi:hypothetical protein